MKTFTISVRCTERRRGGGSGGSVVVLWLCWLFSGCDLALIVYVVVWLWCWIFVFLYIYIFFSGVNGRWGYCLLLYWCAICVCYCNGTVCVAGWCGVALLCGGGCVYGGGLKGGCVVVMVVKVVNQK